MGEERIAAEASAAHASIVQNLEVNAESTHHQTLLEMQLRADRFEITAREEYEARARGAVQPELEQMHAWMDAERQKLDRAEQANELRLAEERQRNRNEILEAEHSIDNLCRDIRARNKELADEQRSEVDRRERHLIDELRQMQAMILGQQEAVAEAKANDKK